MGSSSALVACTLLAALGGQQTEAFLDGMFLPNLMHPNTYRKAVYEPSYSNQNTGYANSRPVLFQWFPWMNPQQQGAAAYETTAPGPFVSFFQAPSWLPWANHNRPLQPQSQVQSSPAPAPTPGQWGPVSLLPWMNNNQGSAQPGQPGPVMSFFQNPVGSLFPWNNRPATGPPPGAYDTPLQVVRPGSQIDDTQKPALAPPAVSSLPMMASTSSLVEPQKVTVEEEGAPMTAMLVEDAVVQQLPSGDAAGVAVQPCQ